MTSKESIAALEAVRKEKNPFSFTKEEWRTFSAEQKEARYRKQREWEKERDAREIQAIKDIVPEVGMKCTVAFWSDRHAATITRILSPTRVVVSDNKTECLDYFGGRYEILPELEEGKRIFTKRKSGNWCQEGQRERGSVRLILHYQHHYIDPHF